MKSIGKGLTALVLACLLGASSALAAGAVGSGLPPVGSTAPGDDVAVNVPAGTTVSAGVAWLQAAVSARETEVTTLISTVASATASHAVTVKLTNLLDAASVTLSGLSSSVASDATIHQIRSDANTVVGLHVFSVLDPQVTELLEAATLDAQVSALLGQEVSIRAAIAAAKSANDSVATANAKLATFHARLESARALLSPLTNTLELVGASGIGHAMTVLSDAATNESTATALVASASTTEQSIVTSLASPKAKAKLAPRS